MYVRLFSTAIDPSDISEVHRIFAEDIKPVFESLPGCASMELVICTERNAGGLVDGVAISRWASLGELTQGVESRGASESIVRILPLLQIEPVIKTYEVLD